MIKNQTEPFCYYIKHQTRINHGQIEPCCWFAHKTDAYNTKELSEYKKFMEHISFHDKKRGLNWKEYFPEIVEYFE